MHFSSDSLLWAGAASVPRPPSLIPGSARTRLHLIRRLIIRPRHSVNLPRIMGEACRVREREESRAHRWHSRAGGQAEPSQEGGGSWVAGSTQRFGRKQMEAGLCPVTWPVAGPRSDGRKGAASRGKRSPG